ncbi:MAG TPA: SAM-dependent methyltransferase [Cyanobacteria bacterium UBA8553]|nr:SAM-dependent methyltransferase [Cyanobacteria bacterium UBA8553]
MPVYDSIGQSYSKFRLPDPRIVDSLVNLLQLEPGSSIADIGAGTGNYSRAIANRGYFLYAVEPSSVMREQASEHPQVQWITGYAENILLATSSVDAVISILATHHFSNLEKAVREMNRIAKTGAIVFLTFDPRVTKKLWIGDYFPVYREYDFRVFPPLSDVVALIQANTQRTVEVSPLMLPHDLIDMFAAAGWRRPEIYLNPGVRSGISALALADVSVVKRGVSLLEEDLNNGRWDAKYGEIRKMTEIDAGYRFLCARVR